MSSNNEIRRKLGVSGIHLMMIKCHFYSEMNYHGHKEQKKTRRRQIMIVVSEQIPFKIYNHSWGEEKKKEEEEIPSAVHMM